MLRFSLLAVTLSLAASAAGDPCVPAVTLAGDDDALVAAIGELLEARGTIDRVIDEARTAATVRVSTTAAREAAR